MTTDVLEHIAVKCPTALAAGRISGFFRAHCTSAGDTAPFRLRVDDVFATLTPAYHPFRLPKYHVTWASSGPAPFPAFSGELRLEADEGRDALWLVLEGHYEAFGSLDAAFDRSAGPRVAIMLANLAQALESGRAEESGLALA